MADLESMMMEVLGGMRGVLGVGQGINQLCTLLQGSSAGLLQYSGSGAESALL